MAEPAKENWNSGDAYGLFKEAGFFDIGVHAVTLRRRFASAEQASQGLENPVLRQLMAKLSEAEREQAWDEIKREFSRSKARTAAK